MPKEIAERIVEALADPAAFAPLRAAARRAAIEQYDLRSVCLPAQFRLLRMLAPPLQESAGNPSEGRTKSGRRPAFPCVRHCRARTAMERIQM